MLPLPSHAQCDPKTLEIGPEFEVVVVVVEPRVMDWEPEVGAGEGGALTAGVAIHH